MEEAYTNRVLQSAHAPADNLRRNIQSLIRKTKTSLIKN